VLKHAEVLPAQPKQRRAKELGVSAYVVVRVGMERLSVLVVPMLFGLVLAFEVDQLWIPVCFLAGNKVASLQDEDLLSRWRKAVGQRTAAGAAANPLQKSRLRICLSPFLSGRRHA